MSRKDQDTHRTAGRRRCSRIHGQMRPSFAAMQIIEMLSAARDAENQAQPGDMWTISKLRRISSGCSDHGPDGGQDECGSPKIT